MACVRGLKWREDGCTGEPGQSGQQGSPSITSRTYARMGRREHNGQKSPSAGRAISLSEGHAPGHALANQLAALPLFSFEFTRSSTSVGFFLPPLASGFGARRAREGWLGRCKLFFARLEFPRSCGLSTPSSLVSRLCCAYMPARASQRAVHQGWTRPNRHTHGADSHAVSLGVATWRGGKVKKSQRCAFRISGLSFGRSVDRQVGPLVVDRRSCSSFFFFFWRGGLYYHRGAGCWVLGAGCCRGRDPLTQNPTGLQGEG